MVDRSGERSAVQVADLKRYDVLYSISRWPREEMRVWTMAMAAPAVSCFALPPARCSPGCVPNDLRDFTQEPYSESPGQISLNSALVVMPFARVHSSTLQSWSVTPVNSKMSSSPRMLLPPLHPMATAFESIGAESNGWALDLCSTRLVSTGGKSCVKITAASTVRGSALPLLKPSIPSWPRGTPPSTGPCGPR